MEEGGRGAHGVATVSWQRLGACCDAILDPELSAEYHHLGCALLQPSFNWGMVLCRDFLLVLSGLIVFLLIMFFTLVMFGELVLFLCCVVVFFLFTSSSISREGGNR